MALDQGAPGRSDVVVAPPLRSPAWTVPSNNAYSSPAYSSPDGYYDPSRSSDNSVWTPPQDGRPVVGAHAIHPSPLRAPSEHGEMRQSYLSSMGNLMMLPPTGMAGPSSEPPGRGQHDTRTVSPVSRPTYGDSTFITGGEADAGWPQQAMMASRGGGDPYSYSHPPHMYALPQAYPDTVTGLSRGGRSSVATRRTSQTQRNAIPGANSMIMPGADRAREVRGSTKSGNSLIMRMDPAKLAIMGSDGLLKEAVIDPRSGTISPRASEAASAGDSDQGTGRGEADALTSPSLAYSKKPRQVSYKPYTAADYSERKAKDAIMLQEINQKDRTRVNVGTAVADFSKSLRDSGPPRPSLASHLRSRTGDGAHHRRSTSPRWRGHAMRNAGPSPFSPLSEPGSDYREPASGGDAFTYRARGSSMYAALPGTETSAAWGSSPIHDPSTFAAQHMQSFIPSPPQFPSPPRTTSLRPGVPQEPQSMPTLYRAVSGFAGTNGQSDPSVAPPGSGSPHARFGRAAEQPPQSELLPPNEEKRFGPAERRRSLLARINNKLQSAAMDDQPATG